MKRSEVRLMMWKWNDAGLLPARLVDELLWLFHGPTPTAERIYLAAFNWWLRKSPDRDELVRLAALLRGLMLDQSDRQWIASAIRKAEAFDDSVEGMLQV